MSATEDFWTTVDEEFDRLDSEDFWSDVDAEFDRLDAQDDDEATEPVLDWRQKIAHAAQEALTEEGAVVVRLSAEGATVASRLYLRRDHGRRVGAVAWSRATRLLNADGNGDNYYVVARYDRGSLGYPFTRTVVVYNGQHSVLWEEITR